MKFNLVNPKWRLFRDGLTDEQKAIEAEKQAADRVFAQEEAAVKATVNTPGFKIIINQVVEDMEYITRVELPGCKEKDLKTIQSKLNLYKSFLNKWNPYMD